MEGCYGSAGQAVVVPAGRKLFKALVRTAQQKSFKATFKKVVGRMLQMRRVLAWTGRAVRGREGGERNNEQRCYVRSCQPSKGSVSSGANAGGTQSAFANRRNSCRSLGTGGGRCWCCSAEAVHKQRMSKKGRSGTGANMQ